MTFLQAKPGFRPSNATKLALLFASMLVLMGAAAVSPALNSMEQELGTSKLLAAMTISLPSLTVALVGFPLGYIADRVGSATVLVSSLLLFTVSGFAGYFCTDIWTLLVTRVFLGIGIAGMGTTATALMGIYYQGDERRRVMALQSAFMGFGGVVLEALGGVLADISWNTPFLIYLIASPVLVVALVSVRNIAMGDLPQREAEQASAGTRRQMAFLFAAIFMLMFTMFVIPSNMSDLLTGMGASMTVCGFVIAFMGLVQTVTSVLSIRIRMPSRYTTTLAIGFALQTAAMVLISADSLPVICTGVGLCGVGMGLNLPTIANNLSRLSPVASQGKTMGMFNCMQNLGIFVSTVVVGSMAVAIGYSSAFHVHAAVMAVFSVFAYVFGKRVLGGASD